MYPRIPAFASPRDPRRGLFRDGDVDRYQAAVRSSAAARGTTAPYLLAAALFRTYECWSIPARRPGRADRGVIDTDHPPRRPCRRSPGRNERRSRVRHVLGLQATINFDFHEVDFRTSGVITFHHE
jgi:hypothetical protein